MNWIVFTLAAYLCLALQTGLGTLLAAPDAQTGVSPSFLLILAVYIGLMAPASTTPWAMLVCGVLVDLSSSFSSSGSAAGAIVGPAALGYLVGAYTVLQLRALVFRHSVFTLAVMVFIVGVFIQLVIVALLTMRGLPWLTADALTGWSAAQQLVNRFFILIYSSLVAVPLGYVLFKSTPAWGFGSKARGH